MAAKKRCLVAPPLPGGQTEAGGIQQQSDAEQCQDGMYVEPERFRRATVGMADPADSSIEQRATWGGARALHQIVTGGERGDERCDAECHHRLGLFDVQHYHLSGHGDESGEDDPLRVDNVLLKGALICFQELEADEHEQECPNVSSSPSSVISRKGGAACPDDGPRQADRGKQDD